MANKQIKKQAIPAFLIPVIKRVGVIVCSIVIDKVIEYVNNKLSQENIENTMPENNIKNSLSNNDLSKEINKSPNTLDKIKDYISDAFYAVGGFDVVQNIINNEDPKLTQKADNEPSLKLQICEEIVQYIIDTIIKKYTK